MDTERRGARRDPSERRGSAIRTVAVILGVAALAVVAAWVTTAFPRGERAGAPSAPAPGEAAAIPLRPSLVAVDGAIIDSVPGVPKDAWNAAISPEGDLIAYVTRSKDEGFCGACADVSRLVVVGTDGTRPRYMTLAGHGPEGPQMPAWSPDGTRIAFIGTNREGNQDIYVVGVDTGRVQHLTSGPADDEFPAWSPDGETIVYDSSGRITSDANGPSPTYEIWRIGSDGGEARRLTHDREPDQAPSFSPDGRRIVFSHDLVITTMDPHGNGILPASPGEAVEGWSPVWSPDGVRVAYLEFQGDRATIRDPLLGSVSSLPLGTITVLDLRTGDVTSLGVQVPSSSNRVSWLTPTEAIFGSFVRLSPA